MQISGNALGYGLNAFQSGQRRVDQAATDIAANTANSQSAVERPTERVSQSIQDARDVTPSIEDSAVALNVGSIEAQAGARVIKTADQVLGTLIDTRA
ncbi:pyrroloquinoline quinone biosynthesis protein PqqE [Pseudomonas sp. LRF_L74]|uniref:pyrroloquinoline quinone biosynthesis protein PqqE n=1 Tax=Pseudomonas sp. LRF_L74 TaxID=3369422 RepID=UPI003F5F276A